MHKVKCYYCNREFDRDKEPFVQVNARRYAHKRCSEESQGSLTDKDAFYNIVKKIYGTNYNYHLIQSQAEEYIDKYHYTWSGMGKCLIWFYEINHNSVEDGNGGIGIVPFIYEEVKKYYYDLYVTEQKNKGKKNLRQVVAFKIQSPRAWERPPHLLNLEDE